MLLVTCGSVTTAIKTGYPFGRVLERFIRAVLKTAVANTHREFESHPFRHLGVNAKVHTCSTKLCDLDSD